MTRDRGLALMTLTIASQGSPDERARAVEAASRDRAEALLLVDDALITRHRDTIVSLATQHRLPVASQYRAIAEAGGLIAYGSRAGSMYRRAAQYVAKILKGARPADLPIEQPTVLLQADEVLE